MNTSPILRFSQSSVSPTLGLLFVKVSRGGSRDGPPPPPGARAHMVKPRIHRNSRPANLGYSRRREQLSWSGRPGGLVDKVTGSPAGIQSGARCLTRDATGSIQQVGLDREARTLAGGNFFYFFNFFNFWKTTWTSCTLTIIHDLGTVFQGYIIHYFFSSDLTGSRPCSVDRLAG